MAAETRRSEFRASRVSACINDAFGFLAEENDEDGLDTIEEVDAVTSDHQGDLNDVSDSKVEDNTCNESSSDGCSISTAAPCDLTVNTSSADTCGDNYSANKNENCSDQNSDKHAACGSSTEAALRMSTVSESDCDDLKGFKTVVRIGSEGDSKDVEVTMRRQSTRKSVTSPTTRQCTTMTEDNDNSDDDDDDDSGVYDAAYRASTWVKVDDSEQNGWVNHSIDSPIHEENDSVFGGELDSLSLDRPGRKESTATTVSESEFRNRYNVVSRKAIQRNDSLDTYQKVMTQQFYDAEKLLTIEKRTNDEDFGFHIAGSCPVFVSTVTPGGAAAAAGMSEGDIIVCIDGQNVVAATHDEVVAILRKDSYSQKLTLELSPRPKNKGNHFRDIAQPIIEGFLLKRGGTALVKTWKKRWCVLKQDNCFYIYKEKSDTSPLGAVPLKNFTITKADDAGKNKVFRISRYGADTYYFAATSEDERLRWAEAIKEASKADTNGMDYWLDISTHHVNMPALSIKHVDCHGYLTKMGGHYKSWKKRYCVLKDACLYYYIDSVASKAKGLFHLHGYKVEEAPDIKKFGFKLVPANDCLRTFCFYADSDMDKERWMTAMQKSIGKWVVADL